MVSLYQMKNETRKSVILVEVLSSLFSIFFLFLFQCLRHTSVTNGNVSQVSHAHVAVNEPIRILKNEVAPESAGILKLKFLRSHFVRQKELHAGRAKMINTLVLRRRQM